MVKHSNERLASSLPERDAIYDFDIACELDFLDATPDEIAYREHLFARSIPSLRQEAAEGNTFAAFRLAKSYLNAWGHTADMKLAMKWFEVAILANEPIMLFEFGWRLLKGDGLPQEFQRGINILVVAAKGGCADASYFLGSHYATGTDGFAKLMVTAFHYYLDAARRGHGEAQWNLSRMYENGEGTKVNKELAKFWLSESAKLKYWQALEQA